MGQRLTGATLGRCRTAALDAVATMSHVAIVASMAIPGPTTRRHNDRLAGNLLRLARIERG